MDVSTSTKSPEAFLAGHPDIQLAYVDDSTGVFYTKLKNSDKVLEWTPEKLGGGGSGGGEPPKGFGRVGFPDDPKKPGNIYCKALDQKSL